VLVNKENCMGKRNRTKADAEMQSVAINIRFIIREKLEFEKEK